MKIKTFGEKHWSAQSASITAFCLISVEKAFKCNFCKTACCNLNLKQTEEWNIQGKKHSSAHSAKLLFWLIFILKKIKSELYRGKSIQMYTLPNCGCAMPLDYLDLLKDSLALSSATE